MTGLHSRPTTFWLLSCACERASPLRANSRSPLQNHLRLSSRSVPVRDLAPRNRCTLKIKGPLIAAKSRERAFRRVRSAHEKRERPSRPVSLVFGQDQNQELDPGLNHEDDFESGMTLIIALSDRGLASSGE
ncbi:MAG: hypothetical protein XD86_0937 [Mesotoga infera]|uniref:Uncharacterized protein n=1 Tax=Mesotoga infera TaxID=1236046 RepID=A0A101GZJ6_9BACT|nr:MAG: hypothetical protein XD86_0937 [Mesotoga infera]